LLKAKGESQGVPPTSYYLFKNPYYDLLISPLTKHSVEFLVNLTNKVVQLLQPILILLKEKGKGGTKGE
jgi:hypothetical protein